MSMIGHIIGLIVDPKEEWKKISAESDSKTNQSLVYFFFLSMLPPIGFFIGTTQVGWAIAGNDPVRLTVASAIPLAILFYLTIILALFLIGYIMNTTAQAYHVNNSFLKSVAFLGYCYAPLYLGGLFAIYPIWWADLILGTAAASYAVRLIYLGIGEFLHVPEEKAFLYASGIFMIVLVYAAAMLAAMVILWEFVAPPVFIT
ncbi:MAG: Yip1 family protein [bacterium]